MTASTHKMKRIRLRANWLRRHALTTVFDTITDAGGEARVAGGAVRNTLLKIPIQDIDIATTLPAEKVMESFRNKGYTVIPTGLDHGTVTVKLESQLIEITTLRRDVTTDGRRATVAYTSDWAEDACRRDFTINAMYLDAQGYLYDYTTGYEDIQKRKVRFVGSPEQRIREDFLRILRYFRFHAFYGNLRTDTRALRAVTRLKNGLRTLSAERVRSELLKLLVAPRAAPTLALMARHGILQVVLPLPRKPSPKLWRIINRLPPDGLLRLSVLLNDPAWGKPHLRLSNHEVARLSALADGPTLTPALRAPERRRLIYMLGAQAFSDGVALAWAKSLAPLADPRWRALTRFASRWTAPQFPLTGHDVMKAGLPAGPQVGETLKRLEDWWIATDFKATRDELLSKLV